MPGTVLFDLDGTLVDSSGGIIESLRRCLAAAGLAPQVELTSALIGPPLRTLISTALGPVPAATVEALEHAFRRDYDARGYLETEPYPGIPAALADIAAAGLGLHLVTNKRLVPTRQILATLGWTGHFATVSTLDSSPGAASKADVVARLLGQLQVPGAAAVLVGDTEDDAAAARANGVAFAWASWGYGRGAGLATAGVPLGGAAELVRHLLAHGPAA